jgi:hypothetical protein
MIIEKDVAAIGASSFAKGLQKGVAVHVCFMEHYAPYTPRSSTHPTHVPGPTPHPTSYPTPYVLPHTPHPTSHPRSDARCADVL